MKDNFFDSNFTKRFKEITGEDLKIYQINDSFSSKFIIECNDEKYIVSDFIEYNRTLLFASDWHKEDICFKTAWLERILKIFGYENLIEKYSYNYASEPFDLEFVVIRN